MQKTLFEKKEKRQNDIWIKDCGCCLTVEKEESVFLGLENDEGSWYLSLNMNDLTWPFKECFGNSLLFQFSYFGKVSICQTSNRNIIACIYRYQRDHLYICPFIHFSSVFIHIEHFVSIESLWHCVSHSIHLSPMFSVTTETYIKLCALSLLVHCCGVGFCKLFQ